MPTVQLSWQVAKKGSRQRHPLSTAWQVAKKGWWQRWLPGRWQRKAGGKGGGPSPSPLPPAKPLGSRQRAPSSHNGVRSLCRQPYWQVAKALPTAFLLAGGKGFFTDKFFATCSLPIATCKAVGKTFATYFRTFADCFWQSAKNEIPVVHV